MVDNNIVSIKPSATVDGLEDVVYSGDRPPKYTSTEMAALLLNTSGPAVVQEALSTYKGKLIGYRELSRYATHMAVDLINSSGVLSELGRSMWSYKEAKKGLILADRKMHDDFLHGMASGYKPLVSIRHCSVWFWSDKEKDIVLSTIRDAGVPMQIYYAYVACALSSLSDLGQLKNDLVDEYNRAVLHVGRVLNNVKYETSVIMGTTFETSFT